MTPDTLVTSATAAEQLGVSRATLSRHTTAGLIRTFHRSPGTRGAILYTQGEIDRYRVVMSKQDIA